MKLAIYSLKDILYQGIAKSVNCKTASGEITILDYHRPLISILASCTIKIIDTNEKEYYIPISSGFIEVTDGGRTKLLVAHA